MNPKLQGVLAEIGAAEIPQVLVFNKLDALPPGQRPPQLLDSYDLDGRRVPRLFVSARSGEGLAALRQQLSGIVLAERGPGMTPGTDAELPDDGH